MADRPPLTDAPARKALGQHFLFDPDILQRTARAAGPVSGQTVIEVGPGPGGLTRALLEADVAKLICVEADPRFAEALEAWPEAAQGRLVIHQGDARRVTWPDFITQVGGEPPALIIANLPYNVGTPLLVTWLKAGAWRGAMALMFQKEVAERACAKPGDKHYGRLAVLTAATCEARIAFTLPPGAFRPPPKVDSAVAVFTPLASDKKFQNVEALETVAAAAFGQRRKMLRAALKPLAKTVGLDAEAWLQSCHIDPTRRAETLDQAAFRRLADHYAGAKA